MSREKEDDLLVLLQEQNFLLAEKVRALTDQNTLLMKIIRLRDVGLDKHGIRAGAITVTGPEGRA